MLKTLTVHFSPGQRGPIGGDGLVVRRHFFPNLSKYLDLPDGRIVGWSDDYESSRRAMLYHARIRLLFNKQHNQKGETQMLIPKLTIEWVESKTANKSASIHCENARVIKKVNAYQPKILGWIAPRESDLNTAKWGFGEVAEHPRITLNTKTVKPNLQFQLDSGMVSQVKFDSFWNTSTIPARFTLKNIEV